MTSLAKLLMYFLIVILVLSCHQNSSINHKRADSTCIADVERAKKDVSKGRIVVTSPISVGGGTLRYEKELKKLCTKYNLVFDYESFSDVISEGQTQGCYGKYMDKIISEKFGTGFKDNLLSRADSTFRANSINDTITYWDCDQRPILLNDDPEDGDDMTAKVTSIDIRKDPNSNDVYKWPFMDIGFIVSPKGKISDFEINYFNPVLDWNKQFKDKLFKLGIATLKKNTIWSPCEIEGTKVWSKNNKRVRFEK